jgi:hypothetical protein
MMVRADLPLETLATPEERARTARVARHWARMHRAGGGAASLEDRRAPRAGGEAAAAANLDAYAADVERELGLAPPACLDPLCAEYGVCVHGGAPPGSIGGRGAGP